MEENSESLEKEEKQQYLIEEIIEQNYDPRLFTLHCESLKEANLDVWTLSELKLCVADFKEKYKSGQTLEQLQDPGTLIVQGCKRAPSELSSIPSLEIQISEPTLINSGFFSQNYVVYTVKTLPLDWEVTREFVDFVWLRQVICPSFPGIFVPPLPALKSRGNISEKTIKKRKFCLIRFMQCLISHPLVLRSEQLRIFLKQADSKAFKEFVERNNTEKYEGIQNFPTIDGRLMGDLVDHSETVRKLQMFYKENAEIMKKLKDNASDILKDLENVTNSVVSLVNTFAKLQEIQSSLQFTQNYQKIYAGLKHQMEKLLEYQKKKIDMVNEHLTVFFKYNSLEQESLKNFVENNEVHSINFRKALLKHSGGIDTLREFYAYFNAQTTTETTRINEQSTQNAYLNFFKFCMKQAELAKNLQNIWKELIEEITS